MPVAGKTGTSEDWTDLTFVGLTEDFVSGVWIGYPGRYSLPVSLRSAEVWRNIIGEYANKIDSGATYPECDTIITGNVCKRSGKIANANCPVAGVGYWKSSNAPKCVDCWKMVTTTAAATTAASSNNSASTQTETVPVQTEASVENTDSPTNQ